MLQASYRVYLVLEAGVLVAGALFLMAASTLAQAAWSRVRSA